MSDDRKFSIEPILSVVATTQGSGASAPCTLNPLLDLIGHVLGRRSVGPSVLGSDFVRETVMTGLVLLGQYPQLARVGFMRPTSLDGSVPEAVYQRWLAREQAAVQLPDMLGVRPATGDELRIAAEQATPIVAAKMRALWNM